MTVGTIAAAAVIIIGAIYGAKKGVLKMGVGLAGWIIVLVFLFALTPHVTRFLTEQTPLESFIYEKTLNYLTKRSDELWERIAETSGEAGDQAAENSMSGLLSEIRENLPDTVNQKIDDLSEAITTGTQTAIQSAKEAAQQAALQSIHDGGSSVAASWTRYLIQGLSLLITWLAAKVATVLLSGVVHVVDKAPVVHGVSHLLGALIGMLIGLLYLWTALVIVDIFSLTSWGAQIRVWVQESPLLTFIAQNNPLMNLLG